MSNPYLGEIRLLPFTFAPYGWAFCDGTLLPISQNDALFNLIGTTYGGDGQSTFALPDLRGRVPMHKSGTHVIGSSAGSEGVALIAGQIAAHAHVLNASSAAGDNLSPAGRFAAADGSGRIFPYAITSNTSMAPLPAAGNSQPHENMPPFLGIHFCISLLGIFPSQS